MRLWGVNVHLMLSAQIQTHTRRFPLMQQCYRVLLLLRPCFRKISKSCKFALPYWQRPFTSCPGDCRNTQAQGGAERHDCPIRFIWRQDDVSHSRAWEGDPRCVPQPEFTHCCNDGHAVASCGHRREEEAAELLGCMVLNTCGGSHGLSIGDGQTVRVRTGCNRLAVAKNGEGELSCMEQSDGHKEEGPSALTTCGSIHPTGSLRRRRSHEKPLSSTVAFADLPS